MKRKTLLGSILFSTLILLLITISTSAGTLFVNVTDAHEVPLDDATVYVQVAGGNWSNVFNYGYTDQAGELNLTWAFNYVTEESHTQICLAYLTRLLDQ